MNSRHGAAPTIFRTIPSSMAEAESLCLKIRALLQRESLCRICFPVELLARECLSNAVIHGNRGDARKSVQFRLWIGRQWVRLQVSDEGSGFAWRKALVRTLDTAKPHGRGLQLYTLYAGRVRFNRRGNQITLWVKKNPTGKEDGNGCLRH